MITCWWGVFFLDNSSTNGLGRSIYRASLCDRSTMDWWKKAIDQLQGIALEGLNSLIILGFWTLWNHKNGCVFEMLTPNVDSAIRKAEEELELWEMAGAKSLFLLTAPIPGI